jgi:hypothetical protein
MDHESLICVKEDLEYLQTGWGPDLADPDIRRGGAVLRRLLVEGVYGQAWRAVGFERQPNLIAVDLDRILGETNKNAVVCAMAWGANFRGGYMASPCINKGHHALGATSSPIRQNGYPGERIFTLSEFLEGTSGIVGHLHVNRREVIKYVANVKGGVHLGRKTKSAEKELIKKLSKFERAMNVHTTDGILVELVAIAQSVGTSEDAAKLCAAIAAI